MPKAKDIPFTQEQLKELITYVPGTGEFFWNELPEGHGYHNMPAMHWNNQFAGKHVGNSPSRTKSGYTYLTVFICGKHYKAHRIAWKWMTGEEPPEKVDHHNRNGLDNRWVNIRDGSGKTNDWNRSRQYNNTSGYSGVTFREGKWRAVLCANNTKKHLGTFENKEDAIDVLKKARADLGFSGDHGQFVSNYRESEVPRKPATSNSGIKCIGFCKHHQKYKVRVTINGKRTSGGYHETLEGACLKLLEMCIEHNLEIPEMQLSKEHSDVIHQ